MKKAITSVLFEQVRFKDLMLRKSLKGHLKKLILFPRRHLKGSLKTS